MRNRTELALQITCSEKLQLSPSLAKHLSSKNPNDLSLPIPETSYKVCILGRAFFDTKGKTMDAFLKPTSKRTDSGMAPHNPNSTPLSRFLLALFVSLSTFAPSSAQGVSVPTVSDTQVGYIDTAIPGNLFRIRSDFGYNFRRPSRAEFFYARTGPGTPGLPQAERSVDFQDLRIYGEGLLTEHFSAFVEIPVRFLNPDINDNATGLGDMNTGFKWAFWHTNDTVATFQLRTYIPTGDADRGLGNNHATIEPGLLFYKQLTPKSALEGEFRYWIPIEDSGFAGNIFRYGIGFHHDIYRSDRLRITPVVEFVGWTVLNGKQNVLLPSGLGSVENAGGDTIFNAKIGIRAGLGQHADVYAGYGRPLTGDQWYENIFRVEVRLKF